MSFLWKDARILTVKITLFASEVCNQHYSMMSCWEPEGSYCHRLCTASVPFWHSTDNIWMICICNSVSEIKITIPITNWNIFVMWKSPKTIASQWTFLQIVNQNIYVMWKVPKTIAHQHTFLQIVNQNIFCRVKGPQYNCKSTDFSPENLVYDHDSCLPCTVGSEASSIMFHCNRPCLLLSHTRLHQSIK